MKNNDVISALDAAAILKCCCINLDNILEELNLLYILFKLIPRKLRSWYRSNYKYEIKQQYSIYVVLCYLVEGGGIEERFKNNFVMTCRLHNKTFHSRKDRRNIANFSDAIKYILQ